MIHTSSSRFRTVAAAVLAVSSISLLGACAGVRFTVRGVGWATDFETIVRAPEWDDDKEKEE